MNHPNIHARAAHFLRYAAIGCAMLAAVSTTIGLHTANPAAGWLVPVFTGVIIAAALGTFWHVLIEAAERVRTKIGVTATLFGGAIAVVVALGASASNMAAAISGQAAVRAELAERVDAYATAVTSASVEARRFQPLVDVTAAAAASMDGKADLEAKGLNGAGHGCGPRCETYKGAASSFATTSGQLQDLLKQVEELRASGMASVGALRVAAVSADQMAFAEAAQGAAAAIDDLNAIDHMPIVAATGMVQVTDLASTLTPETAGLQDRASELQSERAQVTAPVFLPFSVGEATRAQMGGAALQAWIAAGVIDVLPFVFLLLILLTAREPLMRGDIFKREKVRIDEAERSAQIRSDEENIARKPYLAAGE